MKYEINKDSIILDPDPILRAKSDKVAFPLAQEDKETMEKMLQYVRDSKDPELVALYNLQPAVGIAAPQIGISKQMSAISIDFEDENGEIEVVEYALINPRIIAHSEAKVALNIGEGCLSIRDEYEGYVPRYKRIRVRAYDLLQNKEVTIVATDYLSIVLQHEIDHLNGILFYDYINKENPFDTTDLNLID